MDDCSKTLEIQWVALPKHDDKQFRKLVPYIFDEEEKEIYERYRLERKKLEFFTGRTLVKGFIGAEYGIAMGKIKLIKNLYGKPMIQKNSIPIEGQQLCFNITHTDEIVAVVFGHAEQIGIDAEQVKEDHRAILTSVLSSSELEYVNSLPYNVIEMLCMIWTRKEARIKAEGCGLMQSPNLVEVPLTLDKVEVEGYHYESYRLPNNHWLSIVVEKDKDHSTSIKEVKWDELIQSIDEDIRRKNEF